MATKKLCDFCNREIMPGFSDQGYKVTIKRLSRHYDGYAPWVSKTKLDVCKTCMLKIVIESNKLNGGK